MSNLYMTILNNPELAVDYELLIRDLIRVRERLKIPWDDDMEDLMQNRDKLFEELIKKEEKPIRKQFERGLL